jgi:hypothetical protein
MDAKFKVGDLVSVRAGMGPENGRRGRIADPALPVKKFQEIRRKGKYEGHVFQDPNGFTVYWVEFIDSVPGRPSATEVEETALAPEEGI